MTEVQAPSVATLPVREYRCRKCKKVLGEARAVLELRKLCKHCGKMNIFDDTEVLQRLFAKN